MSAKHGSAVSVRKRGRLVACSAVVAFVLSALFASSAGAFETHQTYLGLGDSVAFGYSQQLYNEHEKEGDPATAFEHGYVNDRYLTLKPKLNGVLLVNNGCPGETTNSLIGNGPLSEALGSEKEAPCAYASAWNAFHKPGLGGPLHHEYGAGVSQLENALGTMEGLALAGKPVTQISLNIGANDELHQIKKCEEEIAFEWGTEGKSAQYGGETPEQSFQNCVIVHVKPLFEHILGNIGRIDYTLRYIAGFTGKLLFIGNYDPYGHLFVFNKFNLAEGELLKGSINLNATLNGLEKKLAENPAPHAEEEEGHPPFKACFVNPAAKFNPNNKFEPERLQKWTNMANATEFEGKKNGPDIHPTPEGYKVINGIITTTVKKAEELTPGTACQ